MQNIEIIPVFGTSFTVYMPVIMIIIALITLFDGLPRLLRLFGIDSELSLVTTNVCFKKKDQGMDAELLEKYNSGKAVIAHEIKQLSIAHQKLQKNREPASDSSHHSSSKGLAGSSHSTRGQYANLEMMKPVSAIEDDEEEIRFNSSSTSFYGKSTATATSSAHYHSRSMLTAKEQPATSGVYNPMNSSSSEKLFSANPIAKAFGKDKSNQQSHSHFQPSVATRGDFIALADDDDIFGGGGGKSGGGGRYSNV